MKVLITEPLAEEGIARLQAEPEIEVDVKHKLPPEELKKIIGEYHGMIVRSATKVTPDLLDAAENLKIVGRAGTGVDNIDLNAATGHGVVVVNTPGVNAVSVAELVSFTSQHVTLLPGDLIFTGTPGSTESIKPGDVLEVELEGVGVLKNSVTRRR